MVPTLSRSSAGTQAWTAMQYGKTRVYSEIAEGVINGRPAIFIP
jgi:hypothetical protein